MTLSNALDVARSGLTVISGQTSIISRNVTSAGELLASRKIANVITVPEGGLRLASVGRVSSAPLLAHLLATNASLTQQRSIAAALDKLDATILDPELEYSPAALIGKLNDALQLYASVPHDTVAAQSAVAAARDLAQSLNSATELVQDLRLQADREIASSVERLNTLLAQFETVNTAIVNGTRSGADVTDYLDQRDRLLLQISEEIGIRTISRADGDMVIQTDSGITLFETRAREIVFDPTLLYSAATVGNAVFADGVQVSGAETGLAIASGRLAGLLAIRDEIAIVYQSQLDEIARALIEIFAESDQGTPPSLPDAPGLFTYSGGDVPPAGILVAGLAGLIRVNPAVDPLQGGDATKLRDGGIAGAAYVYNITGAAGFSDRLQELLDKLNAPRSFDSAAQLNTSASIFTFASGSVAWLQEARMSSNAELEYRNTLFARSSEALSNATGVNLDHEMTLLLDLERSYQATARLISSIDEMLRVLIAAAG